jgi:hypothetical protein
MKYFKDSEVLYEKFLIISKYCPISNSNVNTVITNMNNVESSSDYDSSNEVYNINNNNNKNYNNIVRFMVKREIDRDGKDHLGEIVLMKACDNNDDRENGYLSYRK